MAQGKGGKRDPAKASEPVTDIKSLFKPTQIHRYFRYKTKSRISYTAILASISGLFYLCSEILEGAKTQAEEENKKKILPKHINWALCKDEELKSFCSTWLIKGGGCKNVLSSEQLSLKGKNKKSQAL